MENRRPHRETTAISCRKCGACCVAPSIATAIPDMPLGKPAGVRCTNLDARNRCLLYGRPERPAFCLGWQPLQEVCGLAFEEALARITALEQATR